MPEAKSDARGHWLSTPSLRACSRSFKKIAYGFGNNWGAASEIGEFCELYSYEHLISVKTRNLKRSIRSLWHYIMFKLRLFLDFDMAHTPAIDSKGLKSIIFSKIFSFMPKK